MPGLPALLVARRSLIGFPTGEAESLVMLTCSTLLLCNDAGRRPDRWRGRAETLPTLSAARAQEEPTETRTMSLAHWKDGRSIHGGPWVFQKQQACRRL